MAFRLSNHWFYRFDRKISLRLVLIVPFVLQTVGAVGVVGYLSFKNGQEAVANLAHQIMEQVSDRITQKLDICLDTPHQINRLNTDAVRQGWTNPQNLSTLEVFLATRLEQYPEVAGIQFGDPSGHFRAVNRSPAPSLEVASPEHPDLIYRYTLESGGKRGALLQTASSRDEQIDRNWYQQAITTGQPGWSQPLQSATATNQLVIKAFQPVYQPTTKALIGVFSVNLGLDHISDFLKTINVGQSGAVFILDRHGQLIAASTEEKLFRLIKNTRPQQLRRFSLHDSRHFLSQQTGQYLHDRIPNFATLTTSQPFEFVVDGEIHFGQVTPFKDRYGLDWLIVTVVPASEFMQQIYDNTRTTMLLCLAALTVAILFSLLTASWIAKPILRLARASRNLMLGRWEYPLKEDTWLTELEILNHSFNQMVHEIERSFDHVQTALEESKEKFTTIFRASPDPIAIISLTNDRILDVNNRLAEFYGYFYDEIIGYTPLELKLWHRLEDRQHFQTLLRTQGSVRNLEVEQCLRSGAIRTVLLSAEICNLEGKEYAIVVIRDISDRKQVEAERQQAEAALRHSEERYRAIVQDQTELICRYLPDTTILFANDAYCRYFNVAPEAIIGNSYQPMVFAADRERVTQLIQSMTPDNPTVIIENRVLINGELRWTHWVNRLIINHDNGFIEYQSVGRDITDLKQNS
ncbi:PAS domain S-box protein [Pantanalinema rosaneae CENA516]|uniref:PAS domain S-box protein n=1 Tax=Pantanalinema rosaneae TaxID=1620701 RepID=UPI003D6F9A4A